MVCSHFSVGKAAPSDCRRPLEPSGARISVLLFDISFVMHHCEGRAVEHSSPSLQRSPLQEEDEDFYGLEDFFKDVEKELGSRARKRQGKPRSLWEELAVSAFF